jgi:NAD+ diphosphatase
MILVAEKPVIVSRPDRSAAAIRWFEATEAASLGLAPAEALFIGIDSATRGGRFAFTLAEDAQPAGAAEALLRPAVDVRSLATQGVMSGDDLTVIARAKSLAAWGRTSRYCGACGAPALAVEGGWKRICTACAAELFPRVDPVVVMLVTEGARALFARQRDFPQRMYSALAGFVEPGEDVVQAVRRETFEETGVAVGTVTFVASQAWPFPHSLMLGCLAAAATTKLLLAGHELEAARWFDREEVRQMLERRHAEGLWLPGREAIAHALVRLWLGGS